MSTRVPGEDASPTALTYMAVFIAVGMLIAVISFALSYTSRQLTSCVADNTTRNMIAAARGVANKYLSTLATITSAVIAASIALLVFKIIRGSEE
jgi:hypothetical protein